jgi:hypothetical protein
MIGCDLAGEFLHLAGHDSADGGDPPSAAPDLRFRRQHAIRLMPRIVECKSINTMKAPGIRPLLLARFAL